MNTALVRASSVPHLVFRSPTEALRCRSFEHIGFQWQFPLQALPGQKIPYIDVFETLCSFPI